MAQGKAGCGKGCGNGIGGQMGGGVGRGVGKASSAQSPCNSSSNVDDLDVALPWQCKQLRKHANINRFTACKRSTLKNSRSHIRTPSCFFHFTFFVHHCFLQSSCSQPFLCITVSVSLYQASIPSPFWIKLSAQKTTLWCLSLQGCAPERKSTCRFEGYFHIRICHRQ